MRKNGAHQRCLYSASPRDAARLRGGVRVLREWRLARSAPASPLARACALHLLCQDAGWVSWLGCVCSSFLCLLCSLTYAPTLARRHARFGHACRINGLQLSRWEL